MKLREAIKEARDSSRIITRASTYNDTSVKTEVILVTDYALRLLYSDLTPRRTRRLFSPTADDLEANDWMVVQNRDDWVRLMPIEEAAAEAVKNDCCMIRFSNYIERGAKMSVVKPTNSSVCCILKYIRNGKEADVPGWSPFQDDIMAEDWMLIAGPEERLSPFQLAEEAEQTGEPLDAVTDTL